MGPARREVVLGLAALGLAAAAPSLPPDSWPVVQVAPGIYVRQGAIEDASAANLDAIANTGFIIGERGVAVIDPGGSLVDGQKLQRSLRGITDKPVLAVVLSHVHPDHIFGAGAFAADKPVVVGHARLPEALAARGEYYRRRLADILGPDAAGPVPAVTRTIRDSETLDLGGRTLHLTAHPPAHTDADLTVLDERTGSLWAADLLFVDRIPSLDGSLAGWLAALHGPLLAIRAERAIPGHGPAAVPWPSGAADETRYLETLQKDVRTAITRHEDIPAAVRECGRTESSRWKLFEAYNGRNVTEAYKELEWE